MKIVIGTRGSALALWQAEHVRARLRGLDASLEIELRVIKTRGDRVIDRPLSAIGGKGLFIKEIEEALLSGAVDLAVHSLKDMPGAITGGLCIAAVPAREDPRDALVTRDRRPLATLPAGARVGTTSLRRTCQLRARRPDLVLAPLRGNVDTRLRKVAEGEVDGAVLALAGLRRLGRDGEVAETFSVDDSLPAIGQGALAIETRAGDDAVRALAARLDHAETAACVRAERGFLARLGGGCQVPVAGHARLVDGGRRLVLDALIGSPDGAEILRDRIEGAPGDGPRLGDALAARMLQAGGARILAAVVATAVDVEP